MKIETFDQYQNLTDDTAIYPEGNDGFDYLFIGSIGEAGEVCNKLKKIIRGDHKITVPAKEEIGDECGDVMWYISQLARQFNFPFSRMINNDVRDYQLKVKSEKGMLYKYSIRLSFILTQFASVYAFGRLNADFKVNAIRSAVYTLTAIIKALDLDLPEILSRNIIKLRKRKESNTLKGSGDKRQDEIMDKQRIIEPSINKTVNNEEKAELIKNKRLEALRKAREAKKKKREEIANS